VIFRRARFAEVIERQLDLFVRENPDVIEEARERLEAYNSADRDEAEELYGDYVDAVETGTAILADMRDHYSATLANPDGYVSAFNRGVGKRLPEFSVEIEHT
jgi:hypothetical protein